eukprot:403332285
MIPVIKACSKIQKGLMKSNSNGNLSHQDSHKFINASNQYKRTSNAQFAEKNQEKENLNNKSSTQILQAHLKQQQQLMNLAQNTNQSVNLNQSMVTGMKLDNKSNQMKNSSSNSNLNISVTKNPGSQIPASSSSQQISTTKALYQYLKNKHLSKEVQKRMHNDKEGDEQLRLYKQQLRQNSSNKKRAGGMLLHNKPQYKNFETTSSLSKGSSANNTPSKYANYNGGGLYKQQQLSGSLKKVKSQSQFHKTSGFKEQSGSNKKPVLGNNNQNVRSTTSIQQLNKSPNNLNKSLNFNPPGISNTSSNINLLLNESMNIQNLQVPSNSHGQNQSLILTQKQKHPPTSHQQKLPHQTKQNQNTNMQNVNNTALTQNWMNSFLEHYEQKLSNNNNTSVNMGASSKLNTSLGGQQNKANNSGSVVRTSQQNNGAQSNLNTYQRFINNSNNVNAGGVGQTSMHKSNSKSGLSIQLNKSQQNLNGGINSGKHAHGKSISNINQRRGSGIGFSNSNPSTIVVNNSSSNYAGYNSTSSNLNKSFQKNQEQKNSSQNLQNTKNLKKNMSFLANAQPNQSLGKNASASQQQQANYQVNTSSTAHSSKITSAHYSSNNNGMQSDSRGGVLLQNQPSNQATILNNQQRQPSQASFYRSNNQPTNNSSSIQRKKSGQQSSLINGGHSQNLSLTNNNIQLNKATYNGSQKQTVVQNKSNQNYHANQSVIIHNPISTGNQSQKHNQSMVLNGNQNFKNLICNDNQLAFQFDELLRGLDRQVETQVNPLKKFQLEDDLNIEIVPDCEIDIGSISPSGSQNLKDKAVKDKYHHNRSGSNVTQIKLVDNQSQNRLETLQQILQLEKSPQANQNYQKQSEQEKLVLDIFNDIIQIQKNQSDSQSLTLIKDYFSRQLMIARENQQLNDKYQKLKESYEYERQRRLDGEQNMQKMFEEFKKQQLCMTNQEQLLSTLKLEFKKLQQNDINNQTLIKQLNSQQDIRSSQHLNKSISQSNLIKQSSTKETVLKSQQNNYQNASLKDNLQNLLKNSQPIGQLNNGHQTIAFHQKNRSAAIIIPKLDLSKIKRDLDNVIVAQNNQTEENDTFQSQPSIINHDGLEDFMDEDNSEEINEQNNFCLNDADGMIILEDDLKIQEVSQCDNSDEEFILNDLKNLKKSSEGGLRESQLCEGRKSSVMKFSNQDSDSEDFEDIRLSNSNNQSVIIAKQSCNLLIPPLDFSKLRSNQQTSSQQKLAQKQYQQQIKQYQDSLMHNQMQKQMLHQSQIYSNNQSFKQQNQKNALNQSMNNIYAQQSSSSQISKHNSSNLNSSINLGGGSIGLSGNNQKTAIQSKPFVPPLRLSNLNTNQQQQPINQEKQPQQQQNGVGLKLNLDKVKILQQQNKDQQICFQDEFMAQIDQFSQSWREAALKDQRT